MQRRRGVDIPELDVLCAVSTSRRDRQRVNAGRRTPRLKHAQRDSVTERRHHPSFLSPSARNHQRNRADRLRQRDEGNTSTVATYSDQGIPPSGLTIRTGTGGGTIQSTATNREPSPPRPPPNPIHISGTAFTNSGVLRRKRRHPRHPARHLQHIARNPDRRPMPALQQLTTLSFARCCLYHQRRVDPCSMVPTSAFAAMASINANSGTFELDHGREFTTVGSFNNWAPCGWWAIIRALTVAALDQYRHDQRHRRSRTGIIPAALPSPGNSPGAEYHRNFAQSSPALNTSRSAGVPGRHYDLLPSPATPLPGFQSLSSMASNRRQVSRSTSQRGDAIDPLRPGDLPHRRCRNMGFKRLARQRRTDQRRPGATRLTDRRCALRGSPSARKGRPAAPEDDSFAVTITESTAAGSDRQSARRSPWSHLRRGGWQWPSGRGRLPRPLWLVRGS